MEAVVVRGAATAGVGGSLPLPPGLGSAPPHGNWDAKIAVLRRFVNAAACATPCPVPFGHSCAMAWPLRCAAITPCVRECRGACAPQRRRGSRAVRVGGLGGVGGVPSRAAAPVFTVLRSVFWAACSPWFKINGYM